MKRYCEIKRLIQPNKLAKEIAPYLGLQPNSIMQQINRNSEDLLRLKIIFKTRGKSRLIDPDKFINWYLNH